MSNFKLQTMKTIKLLAILFMSSLALVSCSSDDDGHHDDDHEHEEANTVKYTLTNTTNANDVVTLTFKDLDGEGGADGTYEISGPLTASSNYTGTLELLHEHEDGEIEDIGEEIAEDDAEEHEIFYITDITGLQFNKTDVDANSNPLGFMTTVTTGAAGTGDLTVTVIHEVKKPNNGTIADALIGTDEGPGSIDITVTYDVTVQ